MNRRTLIAALGGTAMAWPVVSRGQSRMRKVGILAAGTPDPTLFVREFRSSLHGLGHVEGQNIGIEVRSVGSTDPARLKAGAQELLALKVDVIVTLQTPPTEAAKAVTRDVPIVMAGVGDPVGTGIVASLARPGGNITGISAATPEVTAKNVQLLRELLPAARHIAALCNADDPFSKQFLESIQNAGRTSNVEIRPVFARGAPGVEAAFAELLTSKVDAVIVQPSLGLKAAAELSLKHRIPGASPSLPYAHAGGLVAYTGNPTAMFRMSAVFTDKILKGAKPANLPVEQPTKFDLIVNLKTAKALGLTIPSTMLAHADEVIE
jgi:putative ABC transport system substrate-binding protein